MMWRVLTLSALLAGTFLMPASAQVAFDDPTMGAATSGGTLVTAEPTTAVGSVSVGSTAQAIVRFRNDGGQPIKFGEINLYPSSNVSANIALDQCSANPLQFGGECAIVLALKALKAGEFQTQMLIQHSGRSKLITATVTGTVAAPDAAAGENAANEIQASPPTLDFGSIAASRPILRTIQLRNTTSESVTVKNVSFGSTQETGFTIDTECKELAPGASCLVSVIWSPLLPGPTSGFIVVDHTGTSKLANIPVVGEYNPAQVTDVSKYPSPVPGKGLLVADRQSADFGSMVNTASAVTVTVVNGGDADLMLNDMSFSVPVPGVTLDPRGCKKGTVLKPAEACPLTVRWVPQNVGALKTDLRINHSGTRGVFVMPITGASTGIAQNVGFVDGSSFDMDAGEYGDEGTNDMGIDTQLPGSAGLTLGDIAELNGALNGTLDENMVGVIDRSTGKAAIRSARRARAASNALASYVITSHSLNKAVLMSGTDSKIITHNKPIMLAGVESTPNITPNGVEMINGDAKVSLMFDASLGANKSLLTNNDAITAEDEATTDDNAPVGGGTAPAAVVAPNPAPETPQ